MTQFVPRELRQWRLPTASWCKGNDLPPKRNKQLGVSSLVTNTMAFFTLIFNRVVLNFIGSSIWKGSNDDYASAGVIGLPESGGGVPDQHQCPISRSGSRIRLNRSIGTRASVW
ncbi:hypothetical protein CEXT_86561 [Caerostris extrusa]|uniref:Uncharacterized protein n=1 Tax=Caerostris extrusa TaxID=172846 RepID=A0AAV4N7Q2_CAEEX|nr:hypothetical protein CEXT_86561 [Caerostris extrusa]